MEALPLNSKPKPGINIIANWLSRFVRTNNAESKEAGPQSQLQTPPRRITSEAKNQSKETPNLQAPVMSAILILSRVNGSDQLIFASNRQLQGDYGSGVSNFNFANFIQCSSVSETIQQLQHDLIHPYAYYIAKLIFPELPIKLHDIICECLTCSIHKQVFLTGKIKNKGDDSYLAVGFKSIEIDMYQKIMSSLLMMYLQLVDSSFFLTLAKDLSDKVGHLKLKKSNSAHVLEYQFPPIEFNLDKFASFLQKFLKPKSYTTFGSDLDGVRMTEFFDLNLKHYTAEELINGLKNLSIDRIDLDIQTFLRPKNNLS